MFIKVLSSSQSLLLSATSISRNTFTSVSTRSLSSCCHKLNFFHKSEEGLANIAKRESIVVRSISTTTRTVGAYPSISISSPRHFAPNTTNLIGARDLPKKAAFSSPSFKTMSTAGTAATNSTASDADDSIQFPVSASIRQKLTEEFEPTHLEVINESHMHNVPRNSETHFKVVVVSSKFDSLTMIKRHRSINTVLKEELQDNGGTVHALSIVAKTPTQWSNNSEISPSPKCAGGSKR